MRYQLALFSLVATPLFAQVAPGHRLPGGAERPVRERLVDLDRVHVELRIDLVERRVEGGVTVEFTSLRDGLAEIALDAADLAVSGAEWTADGSALGFAVQGRTLEVQLPRPLRLGEAGALRISYSAQPRSGLYFVAAGERGGAQAWNYGEGGLHYGWLPLYNDTNERFAVEFRITVARPHVALANGTLIETVENADGSRTFHWRQDEPIPNYLLALDVGEFAEVPLDAARVGEREVPLSVWGPPQDRARIAFTFRDSPRMVEFFSTLFGYPYAWPKYDQITLREFEGAMETTGLVGYAETFRAGPDDPVGAEFGQVFPTWSYWDTISHELAHHWFGDLVTCRSLGSLWLNESFATYAHTVWNGHAHGEDDLTYQRWRYLDQYLDHVRGTGEVRPLEYLRYDDFEATYQLETTYLKGALVLHMLRRFVGDDAFYRTLAEYLKSHAFGSVDSRDLQASFEAAAGRNLDWFFGDWIVGGGGHPRFAVSTHWSPERQQLDLSVEQQQAELPFEDGFRLPVEVELVSAEGSTQHTVWIEDWQTQVALPASVEPNAVIFDKGNWIVAELRHQRALAEVIAQLELGDLAARLRAARQLAGDFPRRPEAVAALSAVLADTAAHWGLRQEAARDLGEMGGGAALDALVGAMADADRRVRRAAALGLGRAGGERAAAALRRAVSSDAAEDVVAVAARALGEMHAPDAAAFLVEQLERESRWWDAIRIGALEGLASLEDPAVVPIFARYTDPRYPSGARLAALDGWRRALEGEAGELAMRLRELAFDENRAVRSAAITTLGELHRQDDRAFLEQLAADEADPSLAAKARRAAGAIRAFVE